MRIEDIDVNFKIDNSVNEEKLVYLSVKEKPFDLYGFAQKDKFLRLPLEVAKDVNSGVESLCTHTAGGRVRFKTDSPYVAISVKYPYIARFNHMPLTGTTGFDMYSFSDGKYTFIKSFSPAPDSGNSFEGIYYFGSAKLRDITINFPLYNAISEVYIGLDRKSTVDGGDKYINSKPIVYYGSSITQGGCASRPGNAYQAIITRRFNVDHVNLGLSGRARGEKAISDYLASLDMSAFVYDYDHNAPSVEHLQNTHEPLFKAVRSAHPEIPIIMMTRPFDSYKQNVDARKAVVFKTYRNAVDSGDKNVYFIEGDKMQNILGGDSGTVDGCHPNDLGFMCMAEAVAKVIEPLIGVIRDN